MSGVTFDGGVASHYLTPTGWLGWTGKLVVEKEKAYLVTWPNDLVTSLGKTLLGDVKIVADHAEIEKSKLNIFDKSNTATQLDLAGYRWSKPGEFNGRNMLLTFGAVMILATYIFARKV